MELYELYRINDLICDKLLPDWVRMREIYPDFDDAEKQKQDTFPRFVICAFTSSHWTSDDIIDMSRLFHETDRQSMILSYKTLRSYPAITDTVATSIAKQKNFVVYFNRFECFKLFKKIKLLYGNKVDDYYLEVRFDNLIKYRNLGEEIKDNFEVFQNG